MRGLWRLVTVPLAVLLVAACSDGSAQQIEVLRDSVASSSFSIPARLYPEIVDVDERRLLALGGRREFTDNRLVKDPLVIDLMSGELRTGAAFPFDGTAIDFASYVLDKERVLVAAVMCDGESDRPSVECRSTPVQMAIYDLARDDWQAPEESPLLHGGSIGPDSVFPDVEFVDNQGARANPYLSYTNVDEGTLRLWSLSSSEDLHQEDPIDLSPISPDPPALGQLCASASRGVFLLTVDDTREPVVVGADPPAGTTLRQLRDGEWKIAPTPTPGAAGTGPPLLACDASGPYLVTATEARELVVERLVSGRLVQHAAGLQGSPVAITGSNDQGFFVATASGQVADIRGDANARLLGIQATRPISIEHSASTDRLLLLEDVTATDGEQTSGGQQVVLAETDR